MAKDCLTPFNPNDHIRTQSHTKFAVRDLLTDMSWLMSLFPVFMCIAITPLRRVWRPIPCH